MNTFVFLRSCRRVREEFSLRFLVDFTEIKRGEAMRRDACKHGPSLRTVDDVTVTNTWNFWCVWAKELIVWRSDSFETRSIYNTVYVDHVTMVLTGYISNMIQNDSFAASELWLELFTFLSTLPSRGLSNTCDTTRLSLLNR